MIRTAATGAQQLLADCLGGADAVDDCLADDDFGRRAVDVADTLADELDPLIDDLAVFGIVGLPDVVAFVIEHYDSDGCAAHRMILRSEKKRLMHHDHVRGGNPASTAITCDGE
jgi:hypothetical protein